MQKQLGYGRVDITKTDITTQKEERGRERLIHIDWSGDLVQIGGSVDDLGSDISRTLVSVLFGMMESGEYAEEELEAWVSSILVTAMDIANKEKANVIVKAIQKGSALVQEYEDGLLSPSAWFVEEMAATS